MKITNIFKSVFALARARMKQSRKPGASAMLPDMPDFGALGSGGRVAARTVKPGPVLRKYRRLRKARNKMAARSRRVNNARRKGVSI